MDPLTLGAVMAGSNLVGQIPGAISSYVASKQQQRAADRAAKTIQNYYGQAQGYQQPYLQAGNVGLGQLMGGNYETAVPTYQPGEIPGPYVAPEFRYQEDPGMAYRMQQGQRAIETGAAGAGAGLSGATMKALAKYGQDLGSQEYGNAFDRYMRQRGAGLGEYQTNLGRAQDIRNTGWGAAKDIYGMGAEQQMNKYNRAAGLTSLGEAAAGRLGIMATGLGENLANIYGQRGNVQAAGTMGMGQAAGNALSGIGQGLGMGSYLGQAPYGSREWAQRDIKNKYGV